MSNLYFIMAIAAIVVLGVLNIVLSVIFVLNNKRHELAVRSYDYTIRKIVELYISDGCDDTKEEIKELLTDLKLMEGEKEIETKRL